MPRLGKLFVFLNQAPTLRSLLERIASAGTTMSFNPIFELWVALEGNT